jgi:hypothetical protein
MKELDDNVFIKSWHFKEESFVEGHLMHFLIIYIDDTRFHMNVLKEASLEYAKKNLLDRIDRDLREKGWVKNEPEVKESKYNPADDPYYQNEDLYIPNEINCGS